jgi:PKD repeat protein
MNRSLGVVVSFFSVFLLSAAGQAVTFAPDTSLSAETSNNTSASNAFTGRYDQWQRTTNPDKTTSTHDTGIILNNGALVGANISKVSVKTLFPSSTAKFWVTSQSWFTTNSANVNATTGKLKDNALSGSHIDIGYSSADAAQGQRQIDDMISRGLDGLIVNWQSSDETVTTAFLNNVIPYAAANDFNIIVEEDMGALNFHCDTQTQSYESCVIRDINYIVDHWVSSPAYFKIGTRPVIMLFSLETADPSLNWTTIESGIHGNPMLIWQGQNGFTKTQYSMGAYKWIDGTDAAFYSAAKTAAAGTPRKYAWGSAFKGFDDRIASWTKPKTIDQRCGHNFLDGWKAAVTAFPSGNLDNIHIVTWDDYQEGSEIETGVDNCLGSVNLSVAAGAANWSLTFSDTTNGAEDSIHHFTVYAAQDGQNLMTLQDNIPVSTKTFNLDAAGLPPGTYQIFVKAVGQPMLKNVMSKAQTYVSGGAAPSANITKPVGGASVASPVEFVAQAVNDTPTHWAMYDGNTQVQSFDSNATSIDVTQALGTGQHTITIQYWDPSGAVMKDSVAITVTANSPPVAAVSVSPSSGVAPLAVSATVSGTDGDGTIVAYSIDWGDGSAATNAASGSHSYSAAGNYVVTGTVTDNGGLSDAATATVAVTSATQPLTISLTSPTNGQQVSGMIPVKACASSSNPITNYTIYFNSVAQKSIPNQSCIDTTINPAPGCANSANVTVNVWDSSGMVTKQSAIINVNRSVAVSSPADGATVSTSVHVVSTACSNMATVTTSKIYLDGVEAYTQSGAHIDTVIPVSAHKAHWIRMQSWDATGVSFWGDVNVTTP